MMINYNTISEFDKDFKKLLKRFLSLQEDFIVAKKAAIEYYHSINTTNDKNSYNGIVPIPDFCNDTFQIYKVKKFACKSLKGRGVKSGIRLIYAYFPEEKRVIFIEIYFKGDKENEDRERIKEFLKENS